ncbi:MAG TPA: MFS transporter [Solirubrobacterales bacterium]|jgi:MFS family permease|nr:MFS transporter [Solirubrobacterales bacterium]
MNDGLEASRRRARRNVVLTAAIAGLGGLLFGYDTGVIAGALLFIKGDFDLGSFAQGLVVVTVPIGAVAEAGFAGPAADRYGRRLMILLAAALFIVGALASAAAAGVEVLVAARIVIGVAIGLASAAAPVYISEVAPPGSRGRLVSFFQAAVTIGILVAYLIGLAFDHSEGWRWMLGLGCVPALAGRGRRDQRRDDAAGAAAARPGGTADAALHRCHRDVDLALRPRRRLQDRRRWQHPRLGDRDRQPDGLRRLLCDQPRADLLAAQRGRSTR